MVTAIFAVGLSVLGSDLDERYLAEYFLRYRTAQGMVQDRETDPRTISCAATGFGFHAWAVASDKGMISRRQAVAWINTGLDHVERTTPPKNRGWLFHFTDPDGRPLMSEEVSTIDTALFYLGARSAARRLGDPELALRVEAMIARIDYRWMMDGQYFSMGCYWDGENPAFLASHWNDYNEGVLLYRTFCLNFRPRKTSYNLPLFAYYYPLCFYPGDTDYSGHLDRAIDYQLEKYGVVGVTACDGPDGYQIGRPDIVSPLAVYAASRWSDRARKELVRIPYGRLTPAYQRNSTWVGRTRLGIDEGSTLMAITATPRRR